MISIVSGAFVLAGAFFFLAGTVGLLRFPDIYCRLHALTKADNLGLGLLVVGLSLQPMEWTGRFQFFLTWLAALVAAATVCHLLARASLRGGVEPVTGGGGPATEGRKPGTARRDPGTRGRRPDPRSDVREGGAP